MTNYCGVYTYGNRDKGRIFKLALRAWELACRFFVRKDDVGVEVDLIVKIMCFFTEYKRAFYSYVLYMILPSYI